MLFLFSLLLLALVQEIQKSTSMIWQILKKKKSAHKVFKEILLSSTCPVS